MRILICGVSGMIGHKMWQSLSQTDHDTFGTLHGRRDALDSYGLFDRGKVVEQFEAADFAAVTRSLDSIAPSVIINCVGITKRKPEANDIEKMYAVNALFPHHLAQWAAGNGARVIHFSTDCVFGGADGNYTERSVVTAPDLYGQTKYFGELDYDHCLTIRTSMIGRELAGRTELLEWFLGQQGKTVKGFKHAIYSGLTTTTMAGVIQRIIESYPKLCGKYQIAGPVITKYDLLCQVRDAFGLDIQIVPEETFHCDRTLQSNRFVEATGMRIPSWQDMIAVLAKERGFYEAAALTSTSSKEK